MTKQSYFSLLASTNIFSISLTFFKSTPSFGGCHTSAQAVLKPKCFLFIYKQLYNAHTMPGTAFDMRVGKTFSILWSPSQIPSFSLSSPNCECIIIIVQSSGSQSLIQETISNTKTFHESHVYSPSDIIWSHGPKYYLCTDKFQMYLSRFTSNTNC